MSTVPPPAFPHHSTSANVASAPPPPVSGSFAPRAAVPVSRWLLAGALGITGGFITTGSIWVVVQQFGPASLGWEFAAQPVLQLVFGVVVTAIALLAAPGPLISRIIAVVLFVLGVGFAIALSSARVHGDLPGPAAHWVINSTAIVLLVGGLAWLLASGARWWTYLLLVLTLVVFPLPAAFALANVSTGVSAPVEQAVALVIALLLLAVSRGKHVGRR